MSGSIVITLRAMKTVVTSAGTPMIVACGAAILGCVYELSGTSTDNSSDRWLFAIHRIAGGSSVMCRFDITVPYVTALLVVSLARLVMASHAATTAAGN